MERDVLAKEIYQASHLKGQFLLRSGQKSTEYFDKYQFEAQPRLLMAVAAQLAPLIPPSTEILAALEMGGIPIATALAIQTGLPMVFVRKDAKSYGTCKLAEGPDVNGQTLCVVEDVITTGGQVVTSSQQLRKLGAIVESVVCVIYRGPGLIAPMIEDINLQQINLFTRDQLVPNS
jgi:orotate phosphoribosyltransferase